MPWTDSRVLSASTVHVGGTFAEVAAAEADVARGRHPARPFVLCVQPSLADPSRAPAGKHTLWAYRHVPNGSRVDMTTAVEDQLERFAPGFRDLVLARHTHSPAQLEQFDANLIGGDIGGGAADLRQFIARPVWSRQPWATPVAGLYICSASTPPGGGVHGLGGWHAARIALKDSAITCSGHLARRHRSRPAMPPGRPMIERTSARPPGRGRPRRPIEVEQLRRDRVFVVERRREHRRVVGVDRDGDAGARRGRAAGARPATAPIGCGHSRSGRPRARSRARRDRPADRVVLDGVNAVPDPLGAEVADRVPHRLRAG